MNRPLTIPSHRRPVPPGEILLREFLEPLGVTQADFAKRIGVTAARLSEIIHGKRPLTMDTALRLERALGFKAEAWLRMQLAVDMFDALHGPASRAVANIKPITTTRGPRVVGRAPARIRPVKVRHV
ncbi:MAG TPA: HigA family addiction module antitoxin [Candidatus Elarobacter sp.]|nr:HigA family addiction module antitoxin [Candidatus Elarobacter sp.]